MHEFPIRAKEIDHRMEKQMMEKQIMMENKYDEKQI
jgi:hypothetical protein